MRIIHMLLLMVVLLVSGQTAAVNAQSDGREIGLGAFTVEAPTDSAWQLSSTTPTAATLEAKSVGGTEQLLVERLQVDPSADEQSFLRHAEQLQEAALSQLERHSIHFNYVRLKGAPCLYFDGIFGDRRNPEIEPGFLNTKGYLCRHPTRPGDAVLLQFRHHSASRSPEGLEGALAVAETFFESLVFKLGSSSHHN